MRRWRPVRLGPEATGAIPLAGPRGDVEIRIDYRQANQGANPPEGDDRQDQSDRQHDRVEGDEFHGRGPSGPAASIGSGSATVAIGAAATGTGAPTSRHTLIAARMHEPAVRPCGAQTSCKIR